MKKNNVLLCFIIISFSSYAIDTIPTRDPFVPASVIAPSVNRDTILKSTWIPLYYTKADQVAPFLSEQISSQGKLHYDKNSNQLWVQDDATHLAKIHDMVSHLDKPSPQFLIKAKIINIDREYQKKLGVLFQMQQPATTADLSASVFMNEPTLQSDAGEFIFTVAKLGENHLLDMQLSALEQEGHAKLISSPSLMTLNNQAAIIESGAEVPYQKATSSGATSVSFKKATLNLTVTPLRMPHHRILLHIALNQDKVSALTVNGVPAIETQQIKTQVIVKDQQTVVLGGILETSRARQIAGIPVVDQIPVVGKLFQHHITRAKRQELLIFITPAMVGA